MNPRSPQVQATLDNLKDRLITALADSTKTDLNDLLGPFLISTDKSTFKGQFKSGVKSGYGEQVFQDGSNYLGFYKDGFICGKGIQVFANGDYYLGDWRNGLSNGWGEFVNFQDQNSYEGEWL